MVVNGNSDGTLRFKKKNHQELKNEIRYGTVVKKDS